MAPVPQPARSLRASIPPRQRVRLLASVLAVAALAAIAGTAPASAAPASDSPLPQTPLPQSRTLQFCAPPGVDTALTTTAAVPDELTSLLGVLRRPRTAADQLATDAFGPFGPMFGVNLEGIRHAGVGTDGRSRFVVPALGNRLAVEVPCVSPPGKASAKRRAHHVRQRTARRAPARRAPRVRRADASPKRAIEPVACLVNPGRSAACMPASRVAANGVYVIGEVAGSSHLTGLVPDGVTDVIVTFGPREARSRARVAGNFFTAPIVPAREGTSVQWPRRIEWRMADGSVREPGNWGVMGGG